MDPRSEEAVTNLQCLLSTTDGKDAQEFIVSLSKSGSALDILLQASLKLNDNKKGKTDDWICFGEAHSIVLYK